jgi:hypothetical protein
VLDSAESVMSRDEVLFLKDLIRTASSRVLFVQTKTDAADEEAWKSWQGRNQSIIESEIGIPKDKQLYFPVSSKTKLIADKRHSGRHLEKSGFLSVLHYLNNVLIPAKDKVVSAELAQRIILYGNHLRASLTQSESVLKDTSRNRIKEIRDTIQTRRQDLTKWSETDYRQNVQLFTDRLGDLKRNHLAMLRDRMDPVGGALSELLDNISADQGLNAKGICENAPAFQQELISLLSVDLKNVYVSFNSKFRDTLGDTLEAMAVTAPDSLKSEKAEAADVDFKIATTSLGMHFSMLEAAKKPIYDGMAGGMIATIAVAVVGFAFPPAAALAGIASFLGCGVGGLMGMKDQQDRQRNEAIARLKSSLASVCMSVQRKAVEQFEEMAVSLDRESRRIFSEAVKQMQESLRREIEELENVAKSTKEENELKLVLVQDQLGGLDRIVKDLRSLVQS